MKNKILQGCIDIFLRELGFSKKGNVWNRRSEFFIDVVDVQISKSRDAFTVNCGVLHRDVFKILWGDEPPLLVNESSCTVRSRIGYLMSRKDVWWPLKDERSYSDAVQKIDNYALPFFESMHSLENSISFLEEKQNVRRKKYPLAIMALAAFKYEAGSQKEACDILYELSDNTKGLWSIRINSMLESLSCS